MHCPSMKAMSALTICGNVDKWANPPVALPEQTDEVTKDMANAIDGLVEGSGVQPP